MTLSTSNPPKQPAVHQWREQDLHAGMSCPSNHHLNENEIDGSSDYGSDFTADEELLNDLLSKIPSIADGREDKLIVTDIEDYEEPRGLRFPKILGRPKWVPPWQRIVQVQSSGTVEAVQGLRNGSQPNPENPEQREVRQRSVSIEPQAPHNPNVPDTRSPLDRFRRPPKKALSVTDLVSPSWCELQYWYTLTKHGRKRRTAAMRKGSAIHKVLEDEVHTTVKVDITTKEDTWALRIWNVIQGVRTLRETGMTRELEVWGVIDGEVVNGIIDELSYTCPDPELEASSDDQYAQAQAAKEALPEYQTSITDYLLSAGDSTIADLSHQSKPPSEPPPRARGQKVYITDIKTRSSTTLPAASSFRPTYLQLHLYHYLLTSLSLGNVPLSTFTARYDLDPNLPFTDAFIAQVGGLNDLFFEAMSSQESSSGATNGPGTHSQESQDSTTLLLEHNNLSSLWEFMVTQLRLTFLPHNVSETNISNILSVEYRAPSPTTSKTSDVIGRKSFLYSPAHLRDYIEEEMPWWRGEREVRGVELAEAWKCRSCDFSDECTWRERREDELAEIRRRKRVENEAKSTI